MKRTWLYSILIAILLLLMVLPPSTAENRGATADVSQVLNRAMEIQTRQDLAGEANREARGRLIQKLIAENFLADEMARESLKNYWGSLSSSQQAEYQQLFSALFQDSYTRMVLNFLQQENIEYRGESGDGKGRVVKTVIMRSNEHIPVDYHVVLKGGRWMIHDVEIDAVSIVENYRNSFDRVIRRSSVSELLKRMRNQRQAL